MAALDVFEVNWLPSAVPLQVQSINVIVLFFKRNSPIAGIRNSPWTQHSSSIKVD